MKVFSDLGYYGLVLIKLVCLRHLIFSVYCLRIADSFAIHVLLEPFSDMEVEGTSMNQPEARLSTNTVASSGEEAASPFAEGPLSLFRNDRNGTNSSLRHIRGQCGNYQTHGRP
ncbi:hypothetical protein M9H77_32351 [Catharanthus roseus]|uniref:Uncharacterized protein n=1 Tax=Catharanthus roseus TaxID=4058 RepID=A0ACC0A305_CATRO|nr:hypothetical protein M9H77_32351 [Catharanthus roseus]